jgi:hypothetical protein
VVIESEVNELTAKVHLSMSEGKVSDFYPLMQQGVGLETTIGHSVHDFLAHHLGLDPSYIESTITTIFLDGKPVDDMHTARLKDGSVLALSGAMPGLVGATMRRAGFYASLRSTISHRNEEGDMPVTDGLVVLKLFNVIVRDLGEEVLRHGMWIKAGALTDFLTSRSPDFWQRCKQATWDDQVLDAEDLRRHEWPAELKRVHFSVGLREGQAGPE